MSINNSINIAYINPELNEEIIQLQEMSSVENFNLKKIYFTDQREVEKMKTYFPDAELVSDLASITSDESIELVFVKSSSSTHLPVVEQVMQSGKNLRIV